MTKTVYFYLGELEIVLFRIWGLVFGISQLGALVV
jgi:hypothetical protein